MDVSQYEKSWAAYQEAYAVGLSTQQRKDLLSRSVQEDCVYTDPVKVTTSRIELLDYIEEFRKIHGESVFENKKYLAHHRCSYSYWERKLHGKVQITGSSVAEYGQDGRIVRIHAFVHPNSQET